MLAPRYSISAIAVALALTSSMSWANVVGGKVDRIGHPIPQNETSALDDESMTIRSHVIGFATQLRTRTPQVRALRLIHKTEHVELEWVDKMELDVAALAEMTDGSSLHMEAMVHGDGIHSISFAWDGEAVGVVEHQSEGTTQATRFTLCGPDDAYHSCPLWSSFGLSTHTMTVTVHYTCDDTSTEETQMDDCSTSQSASFTFVHTNTAADPSYGRKLGAIPAESRGVDNAVDSKRNTNVTRKNKKERSFAQHIRTSSKPKRHLPVAANSGATDSVQDEKNQCGKRESCRVLGIFPGTKMHKMGKRGYICTHGCILYRVSLHLKDGWNCGNCTQTKPGLPTLPTFAPLAPRPLATQSPVAPMKQSPALPTLVPVAPRPLATQSPVAPMKLSSQLPVTRVTTAPVVSLVLTKTPIVALVTPRPTAAPSKAPGTKRPVAAPLTRRPAVVPTVSPIYRTTKSPTNRPTHRPTIRPTYRPTIRPTHRPTNRPTRAPTNRPTHAPSKSPTRQPTRAPVYVDPCGRPNNFYYEPEPTNCTDSLVWYINSITLSGRILSLTGQTPEDRALQWLKNKDPIVLPPCNDTAKFRLRQRFALATLWFQDDDDSPRRGWDWDEDWLTEHECEDADNAIQCELIDHFGTVGEQLTVTEIDNHDSPTYGTLPPDLGLLSKLTSLDLSENKITGTLPATIGLLTNLEDFDMSYNVFKGSIPSCVGLWSKLTSLFLSDNRITGTLPATIGLWTDVKNFYVEKNVLKGSIPSSVGKWGNLRYINLKENMFTGTIPTEVGAWTNVHNVLLNVNKFNGTIPTEVGKWTSVVNVHFDENRFRGSLPESIGNRILARWILFDNNRFTGTLPRTIQKWTSIDSFDFDNNYNLTMYT